MLFIVAELYPAKDIEAHAASCRTHTVSDSDSDDDNSLYRTREQVIKYTSHQFSCTLPVHILLFLLMMLMLHCLYIVYILHQQSKAEKQMY